MTRKTRYGILRPMSEHHDTETGRRLAALDDVLTTSEVADYLKLPEERVRKMCRDGNLRAFRIGKSWRVSKWVLAEYVGATIDPVSAVEVY